MHDWPRLDVIQCTTGLEVRLLAELIEVRKQLSRLKSKAEPPPLPKPEPKPKPEIKIVKVASRGPYRGPPAFRAGIKRIQIATAKKFGVTWAELLSPHRQQKIARARHVAVMLCYALTPHSYPFIGRFFNNRDHTTMLNSVNVMRQVHDELVAELNSADPLQDWVDAAYEKVMAGRAKPPVEIVMNVVEERIAYAESVT